MKPKIDKQTEANAQRVAGRHIARLLDRIAEDYQLPDWIVREIKKEIRHVADDVAAVVADM